MAEENGAIFYHEKRGEEMPGPRNGRLFMPPTSGNGKFIGFGHRRE
jgi:hypothetical protein